MSDFKTVLRTPCMGPFILPRTIELRPIEMHVFPEGSRDDKASFALVMATSDNTPVAVAQLTLRMLFNSMDRDVLELIHKELKGYMGEKPIDNGSKNRFDYQL